MENIFFDIQFIEKIIGESVRIQDLKILDEIQPVLKL